MILHGLPALYIIREMYASKVPLFNIFNIVSKSLMVDSENILQVEVNGSPRRIYFFFFFPHCKPQSNEIEISIKIQ